MRRRVLTPGIVASFPVAVVAGLGLAACKPGAAPPVPAPAQAGLGGAAPTNSGLPPVPAHHGPLALTVVYPKAGATVEPGDSSFILGSTGTGDATLSINGRPVRVWPNGAWIAWIPFPRDSLMRFDLVARTATDSVSQVLQLARSRRPRPAGALWLDDASIAPAGKVWWPRDEYLPVVVRASDGARVQIRFTDGTTVPLLPEPSTDDVPPEVRAFDSDSLNLRRSAPGVRYRGLIRGRAIGVPPGPIVEPGPTGKPPADGGPYPSVRPVIEAIRGADTAWSPWPVQLALLDTLPVFVALDDDGAGAGGSDSITVGRALPGGTYHWFFPTGTRVRATGRINGDLRIRLSASAEAWVNAAEARPTAPIRPRAVVGSVTLSSQHDRVVLRIPVSQQVAYTVIEGERSLRLKLYGAAGDVDWMRYGPADTLVSAMRWEQETADEVGITIDLATPVWGYRTRWNRSDLLVEIRRPPAIDRQDPLRGRLIVVDPGHPPAGSTGPTGYYEADANLAVALVVRELLSQAGARVVLTRSDARPLELWPRAHLADSLGADLLVSIHNNALPDGVNPFTNNGASVFYNHRQSLALARAIQARLVLAFGVRDLGVGWADLALVRPTWMPAVLTEGLFMILPEQEAALRSAEGQQRYAEAVVGGIREFLMSYQLSAISHR